MKIYTLAANENWVCDRFVKEWNDHNPDLNEADIRKADVIWLLASWCWNQLPFSLLNNKKVVCTIHHLVPDKLNQGSIDVFLARDRFVDLYHVPCKKTMEQVSELTTKPIAVIPFWANQDLWFNIQEKEELRKKHGLNLGDFIIGSFQRDTEGHDLKTPKLEKGPDIFCDLIERSYEHNKNVSVLLAGWRRQYVIKRLESAGIPYKYFELPDFKKLNELYNCLDLYMVTSRYEGGPQSVIECALSKTPIISTDVGLASEFLHKDSIFSGANPPKPNIEYAYNSSQKIIIPKGQDPFRKMFKDII